MASSARIDELLKKFEENPRRYFAPLANEYRKAGDVQRAIALCREHLPQQPGHMSGHIVYGQALFEAREFDEARQVFEEALRLDPENLIALRHLGDIARDHGDVASARDWYQRVLDADPRNEEIAEQIAALSSMTATAAEAGQGADVHAAAPALDSDLIADIAAGVAEPPPAAASASNAPIAPSTGPATTEPVAPAHELLDDALLGASFGSGGAADESGRGAPEAPSDYAGTIDLPGVDAGRSAVPSANDDALDFDAMEGIGATPVAAAGPSDDVERERGDADAAVSELPTEELSISELSVVSARDDDASFGDIDLGADSPGRSAGATLDLDDSGMAPTPATGVDAEPTGGADFSDFALADAPVEAPAETSAERAEAEQAAAEALPESAAVEPATLDFLAHEGEGAAAAAPAADASEGYSLGRLGGLESMEFVPPESAAPAEGAFDPTYGRTLREDAEPSSATPAAFVTETMAELYLQQGFRDEALGVYRQLLEQNPNDANLRDRVAQLERGSVSTVSAAAVSDSVIEAAQQRGAAQAAGGGRTVRAFFASLAARRAPAARAGAAPAADDAGGPAAEARAADAYVEAIGEGYGDRDARDAADASSRAARFDDFGFPTVDSPSTEGASAEGASAPAEELPESAAIEPATLDYLAHEGTSETAAPAGPVDTLFDGAAVSTNDEAAAATLADAFGAPATSPRAPTGGAQRVATPGRGAVPARDARTPATRPAARELSLDDVFRETPRRSGSVRREGAPSFSFDQFFAEGSGASGRAGAPRAEGTSASGSAGATPSGEVEAQRGDEEATSADIEQFNAWLEGLKKK